VTPNRRGMRSRELVLDAAERVMAEQGFEAATLARVVEEAGIPPDSPVTIRLARIALAAVDGAFVASQADPAVTLEDLLEPLVPAVGAMRRALLAKAR
jgi:Bacterial regulatory proteins, tetR family